MCLTVLPDDLDWRDRLPIFASPSVASFPASPPPPAAMRLTPRSLALLTALTTLAAGCKDSNAPERPGPPTDIAVSAGNAQTGSAGNTLIAPIAAKVTDAKGRGVPNVLVYFLPAPGSGSVNPLTAHSNGSGVATTLWTLPSYAGADARVRALLIDTTTGALVDSTTFTATVVGGAPNQLWATTTPSLAATGSTIPLEVVLNDQFGNRSPNATVKWAVTAGGGSVSPASTTSDANGVAKTNFTLGAARGTNTVTATSGALTTTFTIEGRVAGQPEYIATNSYQTVGSYGAVIPLAVTVADGLSFAVAGATVTWTVTSGGGTVTPTTSTTNASGVATSQLTLGTSSGITRVEAKVGSLTTTFSVEIRELAPQLTNTAGESFGIARTSGGRFVVSLIRGGAVVTFDEATPQAKTTIATGGTPVVVAVDAAGAYAYVSNMAGSLDIIDLAANTTVAHVPVNDAHALAISPSGDRVFVTTTTGHVYGVSTATRAVVDSVAIPYGPWGIAFRTTGSDTLMYVSSRDGGTVTEVDAHAMTVRRTFTVNGRPHGLVISPDGATLYAADNSLGRVIAISTSTGTVTGTVALGGAFGIAISPDGSTLYVTTDNARAAVIATSTMAITKLYDTGANGRQVVAAPDGATGWSANEGGWVDIIRR